VPVEVPASDPVPVEVPASEPVPDEVPVPVPVPDGVPVPVPGPVPVPVPVPVPDDVLEDVLLTPASPVTPAPPEEQAAIERMERAPARKGAWFDTGNFMSAQLLGGVASTRGC